MTNTNADRRTVRASRTAWMRLLASLVAFMLCAPAWSAGDNALFLQHVKLVGFLAPGRAAIERDNAERDQLRKMCVESTQAIGKAVAPLPDDYSAAPQPSTVDLYANEQRVLTVIKGRHFVLGPRCAMLPVNVHRLTLETANGRCEVDVIKRTARGICDDALAQGITDGSDPTAPIPGIVGVASAGEGASLAAAAALARNGTGTSLAAGAPASAALTPGAVLSADVPVPALPGSAPLGYDATLLRAMSGGQRASALARMSQLELSRDAGEFRTRQRDELAGTGQLEQIDGVACEHFRLPPPMRLETCVARPPSVARAFGSRALAGGVPGLPLSVRANDGDIALLAETVEMQLPVAADFFKLPDFVWAALRRTLGSDQQAALPR